MVPSIYVTPNAVGLQRRRSRSLEALLGAPSRSPFKEYLRNSTGERGISRRHLLISGSASAGCTCRRRYWEVGKVRTCSRRRKNVWLASVLNSTLATSWEATPSRGRRSQRLSALKQARPGSNSSVV